MTSFKIMAPYPGATLWLHYSCAGSIEIQLSDCSEEASNSFGADVTYTWTVQAGDRQLFPDALACKTGRDVVDRAGPTPYAFRIGFKSYADVRSWIDQHPQLFEFVFDSWA